MICSCQFSFGLVRFGSHHLDWIYWRRKNEYKNFSYQPIGCFAAVLFLMNKIYSIIETIKNAMHMEWKRLDLELVYNSELNTHKRKRKENQTFCHSAFNALFISLFIYYYFFFCFVFVTFAFWLHSMSVWLVFRQGLIEPDISSRQQCRAHNNRLNRVLFRHFLIEHFYFTYFISFINIYVYTVIFESFEIQINLSREHDLLCTF